MILQVGKIIKDPPKINIGNLLQNHIENHIRETNWDDPPSIQGLS